MKTQPIIVFLDIDGVLTSSRTHCLNGDKGIWHRFDPNVIQFFKVLKDQFNYKFVFSTTWRYAYHIDIDYTLPEAIRTSETILDLPREEQLKIRFNHEGIDESYFHEHYVTKRLGSNKMHGSHQTRGYEVEDWLGQHPEITKYIIIDDIDQFLASQRPFFVQTDEENGVLFHHYRKIMKLFNELSK